MSHLFSEKQLGITKFLWKNKYLFDSELGSKGPMSLPFQEELLWIIGSSSFTERQEG